MPHTRSAAGPAGLRRLVTPRAQLAYRALRRVPEGLVDRCLGIETRDWVTLASLGQDGPGRVDYEPSRWLDLRRVLHPREVDDRDVFLDLGAGKGRVVLAAGLYPFRRVVGVEVAEELTAIAQRNVTTWRGPRRCGQIELVTADVAAFRVPDDVTVAYIYNALRGRVFDAVVSHLLDSVRRRPRPLRVIYANPTEHERLVAGGFELVRVAHGPRRGRPWARSVVRLYALRQEGAEAPARAPAAPRRAG